MADASSLWSVCFSFTGLLVQKVQAEFLLGYRQLIGSDVGSFDDYRAQIAAITVKPKGFA